MQQNQLGFEEFDEVYMKAIILDMYGVIMKEPGEGFVAYVNQTFPDYTQTDVYEHWMKADLGEITSLEVLSRLGYVGDLQAIEKEYLDTLEIDKEFYTFAEKVKTSRILGLISDDSSEWSLYLRNKFGLNSYFEAISISGEVKVKKPSQQIYMHSLKQLGYAARDCVYVDDRVENVQAAIALGMDGVLFNSRNVEYDGRSVESFEELAKLLGY